jgi:hypothetical protein
MNDVPQQPEPSSSQAAGSAMPKLHEPKLGYETAVKVVDLVSREIYARFNAMLTVQGFFLAAIGLFLTNANNVWLGTLMVGLVSVVGETLCWTWKGFIRHGVAAQKRLREEAYRVEREYYTESVSVFSRLAKSGLTEEDGASSRVPNFEKSAIRVVCLFQGLYALCIITSVGRLAYLTVLAFSSGSLSITVSIDL